MFILETSACQSASVLATILFIKKLIKIISIIVPAILIVLITLDFVKAVVANEEDDMKRANKTAIKRVVIALVVFFIPIIVDVSFSLANSSSSSNKSCYSNATDQVVKYLSNAETEKIVKDEADREKLIAAAQKSEEEANQVVQELRNNEPINNEKPLTGMELNYKELTLLLGNNEKLEVLKYEPQDTTDSKIVTWSSDDENIATVNNGIVTAKGLGSTIIKATSANGIVATSKIDVVEEAVPLLSISLNKTNLSLYEGNQDWIEVIYNPSNTTEKREIVWESENSDIAIVDNGLVTAKKEGITKITATSVNGKTAECIVTVLKAIPIDSIKLNETKITLKKGKTKVLKVTYNPENTTEDKTISWTTSNSKVAKVDSNGKITAVGLGKATIVATTKNGKSATCEVTVKKTSSNNQTSDEPSNNPGTENPEVIEDSDDTITEDLSLRSIRLNQNSATLYVGNTLSLKVTYNPSNTTSDKTITWSTSNNRVATVSASGKVKAIGTGDAIITAKTKDGKTATCYITVKASSSPPSTDDSSSGCSWQYLYSMIGFSDYNDVKCTKKTEGERKHIYKGHMIIHRYKCVCGTEAEKPESNNNISVSSIKLSQTSISLKEKQTQTLTVTYSPSNATKGKSITWKTDNAKVAKVSSNGKITAVGLGSTTITATTSNGKSATCQVIVIQDPANIVPVKSIILDQNKKVIVGSKFYLKPAMYPSNSYTKTFTWTSSNNAVATVDTYGGVYAKSPGTAKITVKTDNGKKATCTVKVVAANCCWENGSGGCYQAVNNKCTVDNQGERRILSLKGDSVKLNYYKCVCNSGENVYTASNPDNSSFEGITLREIKLNYTNVKMNPKDKLSLKVTYVPADATNKNSKLTWTTSNRKVAKVSSNGEVTAVGTGRAIIAANISNGPRAVCDVTVVEKPAACSKTCGTHEQLINPGKSNCYCDCKSNYEWVTTTGGQKVCYRKCGAHQHHVNADCKCDSGYTEKKGICVKNTSSTSAKKTCTKKCGLHETLNKNKCTCSCKSGYKRIKGDCLKSSSNAPKPPSGVKKAACYTTEKKTCKAASHCYWLFGKCHVRPCTGGKTRYNNGKCY